MVILTNCLNEKVDEGCLKVANSLTKRIKANYPSTTVISYGRKSEKADLHLRLNKLFINGSLFSIIRKKKEQVLYIPFSSNTKASVFRTWILSLFSRSEVYVLFALRYPMDNLSRKLLKWSKARIIVLSQESFTFFHKIVSNDTIYLKTGVNVHQFKPIDDMERAKIRKRYDIAEGKKVLLHVGHLKEGRNIRQLLKVGDDFHVFLVVSTMTVDEQNKKLKSELEERPNTTIIDAYLPNIQEVYQMADVYFFPVQELGNCIDVPLSVLEAASCNLPVVTTPFGELRELLNKEGFYQIESFEPLHLNSLLETACAEKKDTRKSVLEYDWDLAVNKLMSPNIQKEKEVMQDEKSRKQKKS